MCSKRATKVRSCGQSSCTSPTFYNRSANTWGTVTPPETRSLTQFFYFLPPSYISLPSQSVTDGAGVGEGMQAGSRVIRDGPGFIVVSRVFDKTLGPHIQGNKPTASGECLGWYRMITRWAYGHSLPIFSHASCSPRLSYIENYWGNLTRPLVRGGFLKGISDDLNL